MSIMASDDATKVIINEGDCTDSFSPKYGGCDLIVIAMITNKATTLQRLSSKKQTLDDAYAVPANFLEIDVINPITHGVANKRYTGYECLL